jgi:hypothetical protein
LLASPAVRLRFLRTFLRRTVMPTTLGNKIEDAVASRLWSADPDQRLSASDFHDMLLGVAEKVENCMEREARSELDEEDLAFIERRVAKTVRSAFDRYDAERATRRFCMFDRVGIHAAAQTQDRSSTLTRLHRDSLVDSVQGGRRAAVGERHDPGDQ